MSRSDVRGFTQRNTWAGSGSVPFGLFDCEGWLKPAIRLSNALSLLPRLGLDLRIISIRPGHWLPSGAYVNLRGSCGPHGRLLADALSRFHLDCSRACRVCGRAGFPIPGSGALCRRHASVDLLSEYSSDKRQIRHSRRVWQASAGLMPARHNLVIKGMRLPVYELDGRQIVCTSDAAPGGRQQLFYGLVEDGLCPIDLNGRWVFELNSKMIKRKEL